MPRYKTYGPISHDINGDPQVWEFTARFGDRSFRTLVEVLMIIDRSENRWRLVGDWSGNLSRKVRQSVANVRRQVLHMVAVGWLLVEETTADGSPLVLSAAKYWDYHYSRETKNKNTGTIKGRFKAREIVPTTQHNTTLHNTSKEEESGRPSVALTQAEKKFDDLGLGERHPAALCGWELWHKLETFWRSRLKPLGIIQLELIGKQLGDLKAQGHDPAKVVEKATRRGWMDLRPLDADEIEQKPGDVMSMSEIRRRAAERAGGSA